MKNVSINSIFTFFVFALLSVCGISIVYELHKANRQSQAALSYRMYDDFFLQNSTTMGIVRAIENDSSILVKNGGEYEECDIDDYLDHFELLKNQIDDGIQPEKNVYSMYGYYIVRAKKNKEIWGYVVDIRKRSNDSTFYRSFEYLANRFASPNSK